MPDIEAPHKIEIRALDDYLEAMSKAVFQSGMSWRVVESKWNTIREAFMDFQIGDVAAMSEEDINILAQDARVIRNH